MTSPVLNNTKSPPIWFIFQNFSKTVEVGGREFQSGGATMEKPLFLVLNKVGVPMWETRKGPPQKILDAGQKHAVCNGPSDSLGLAHLGLSR